MFLCSADFSWLCFWLVSRCSKNCSWNNEWMNKWSLLNILWRKNVYISLHMSDMYYIIYYIYLLVSSNLNWLYIFVSLYSFTFLSFMDISPSDYLSPSELKFLFAFLYPRFILPFLIFHTTLLLPYMFYLFTECFSHPFS